MWQMKPSQLIFCPKDSDYKTFTFLHLGSNAKICIPKKFPVPDTSLTAL